MTGEGGWGRQGLEQHRAFDLKRSTDSKCKSNSVIYDFNIFFIDKYMFSLRNCRYSLGNLMIEILKVVEMKNILK